MSEFWNSLGRGARRSLIAGAVVIILACASFGFWALHTEYEVLFSNLAAPDAAAMAAELDRLKQPYKIGDDGASILVDRTVVHRLRMKLMDKELPLHGAVGFELFNNSDFGMTEFAQKVNYQRALQGEITRTILSLEEIETARIHIALPEDSLFKTENNRPKASVILGLRHGRSLRREQIGGIQRLVAAAVPGIQVQDVTLTDVRGVALTHGGNQESAVDSGGVDLKRDIERHLAHKATSVLESAFGMGTTLASVDVVLDLNQVRVTKEEVLGAPGRADAVPTGVLIKERESIREGGPKDPAAGNSGSTARDAEYQVGRRVEQVVSQPGAVLRIQVAVVIKADLDVAKAEQARALVAAAVGAMKERGDVVVLQTFSSLAPVPAPSMAGTPTPAVKHGDTPNVPARSDDNRLVSWIAALSLAACFVTVLWAMTLRPRRRVEERSALNEEERSAALLQLRQWIQQPGVASRERTS